MAISAEEIKNYNNRLSECKQRSVKIQAELEVTKREIDRLSAELSEKLGKTITEENIMQVYTEYMQEIAEKINVGTAILDRISEEQQNLG